MQAHTSKLVHKNDSKDIIQRLDSDTCACDLIYKAAKNPNKNEAKAAINKILSFATIDAHHNATDDIAVSKLAAEGDIDTVNFLRNEFNASLLWIASGYARGGHVAEANKVLALAQTPADRVALWKEMVGSYALGGHVAEANKILALAQTPADQLTLLQYMAASYARGGHVAEANKLLTLAQTPADRLTLLQYMGQGYALGGHVVDANKLLVLAQTPADRLTLWIASGYARGGYVAETNKVLALAQTPADRLALWQEMAGGYALGGHVAEANKILALAQTQADRLALLQAMVTGYALSGHVADANKVLALAQTQADRLVLLQSMAYGCARGGHVAEASKVLALAQTPADRLALSKIIATHLNKIAFVNERASLQTLATFNPDFQKNIASELKDSKEINVNVASIVPKASKLNTVMTTQKLSFNQAMGWIQPEMQTWLLQGPQLINNGKLTATLFLSISTYLSPNTLSDTIDLSNKFTLTTCRERFFKSLSAHNQLVSYQMIVAPSEKVTPKKNSLNPKSSKR